MRLEAYLGHLEGYLGHLEAYLEHLKFSETVFRKHVDFPMVFLMFVERKSSGDMLAHASKCWQVLTHADWPGGMRKAAVCFARS